MLLWQKKEKKSLGGHSSPFIKILEINHLKKSQIQLKI